MKEIKGNNGIVIAIGDGINDAPLLALADVGVAVGNTGSDLAIETSDAVIMDGKLSSVNKLIKTSKKTKRIVMENIIFKGAATALVTPFIDDNVDFKEENNDDIDSIEIHKFDKRDIVRHALVQKIVEAYEYSSKKKE